MAAADPNARRRQHPGEAVDVRRNGLSTEGMQSLVHGSGGARP
jgi:hypothetical protein